MAWTDADVINFFTMLRDIGKTLDQIQKETSSMKCKITFTANNMKDMEPPRQEDDDS